MNLMTYATKRNLYYLGILSLLLYALQVPFIIKYVHPILNYELFNGITIISIIAIPLAIAVFAAWRYRKIG